MIGLDSDEVVDLPGTLAGCSRPLESFKVLLCRSIDIYIYIIYTPNLGFETAVSGREREQGRFRGSIEGARGSTMGQCRGAAGGSLKWVPCSRSRG